MLENIDMHIKTNTISINGEIETMNCPINEQTGDGRICGRCWFYLPDGITCPRHGEVEAEVKYFNATGKTTRENTMRRRKAKPPLARPFNRQTKPPLNNTNGGQYDGD